MSPRRRRRWPWIAGVAIIGTALAGWWYFGTSRNQEAKGASRPSTTLIVSARAESRDVPVRIRANGSVTALQSVEFRPQITSTVSQVHIREGQTVHAGELLFSLDARAEQANMQKAAAQIEKDRADLATARRNLERQQELFRQKFISQAALDQVQNQVDTLTGQLAVDTAAAESARVARAYTEIRASFAGRTGTIPVRPGSLVQPATPLVTVTQIDPIAVSFTVPEKELPALQAALRAGKVPVTVTVKDAPQSSFTGEVTFVDNAVDPSTGTIKVKAEFSNRETQLWPGMYVNVQIAPRVIRNATVVPAQAVQTGPDNRFVYSVGEDRKVTQKPVTLAYVEEGLAVVEGIPAGTRVVVEGAQNLRPGSNVTESQREGDKGAPQPDKGEGRKGKKAS
ncbi:MAG TPA: efflux RND transporter periplasmic adaptor subunit [Usitatibacter sp.]|nr:efflux RND transporter periplasmic adaptor subunit [Usitatibacter sp.]